MWCSHCHLPETTSHDRQTRKVREDAARKVQFCISNIMVQFLVDERSKNKHCGIPPLSFLGEYKQTVNFFIQRVSRDSAGEMNASAPDGSKCSIFDTQKCFTSLEHY